MILILHNLDFENGEHTKFEFNWSISFRDITYFGHHHHHQCSAQSQALHCKRRNLGCSSAKGRSSTANSGTKAAVLPGIK